jgi:uncharacterized BrkB/YihY/UPF0761 family membrane protein
MGTTSVTETQFVDATRSIWNRVHRLLHARGELRQAALSLYLQMAVVALMLLIACVNITNLLLARGAIRQRFRCSVGAWSRTHSFGTPAN